MSSDKDIAVLTSINDVSAEDGKDVILTTIVPVLGTLEPETVAARDLFTYSEGQRIIRKIDMRLVSLLILCNLLRGMDGSAISYVRTMNPTSPTNILNSLNMSLDDYSYTLTVWTIFYGLGEIPSNLLMKRTTPRWHYIRIITLWSLAAGCQAAAKNKAGLLTARAFLGLFEAGMAPGSYMHLTYWYRPDEIGIRIASISALYQFCNIFNALITYGLTFVDGRGGLGGWQWTFIIQAILGGAIAILVFFQMTDFPGTCKWLTEDERAWVLARLPANSSRAEDSVFDKKEFMVAVKDPANWTWLIMILFFNTGLLGYQFWLPTIILNFGVTDAAKSQLLNIPPATIYWLGGISGAYLNDRLTMVPRPLLYFFTISMWLGAIFCLAFIRDYTALYAIVCVSSLFSSWSYQSYVPWRTQSIRGSTYTAFTMALLTGIGQMSGVWTAQIFRAQYGPRYTIPFMICAGMTACAALMGLLAWKLTYHTERETRRISRLRRKAGKQHNVVVHDDIEFDDAVARRNDPAYKGEGKQI